MRRSRRTAAEEEHLGVVALDHNVTETTNKTMTK